MNKIGSKVENKKTITKAPANEIFLKNRNIIKSAQISRKKFEILKYLSLRKLLLELCTGKFA